MQAVRIYGKEFDEWAKNSLSNRPIIRTLEINEPAGIIVTRGKGGIKVSSEVEVRVVKDNTERGWHIVSIFPIAK